MPQRGNTKISETSKNSRLISCSKTPPQVQATLRGHPRSNTTSLAYAIFWHLPLSLRLQASQPGRSKLGESQPSPQVLWPGSGQVRPPCPSPWLMLAPWLCPAAGKSRKGRGARNTDSFWKSQLRALPRKPQGGSTPAECRWQRRNREPRG